MTRLMKSRRLAAGRRTVCSLAGACLLGAMLTGCSGSSSGSGSGSSSLHTGSLMFIRAQLQLYHGTQWHDFDNDGDLDALENPTNQDFYLSRGNPTEIVGERMLVAEGASPSVADFNLDGLLDVAYIARIDARGTVTEDVAVILQLADGGFGPPALLGIGVDAETIIFLKTGDVDGDGATDVVISTFPASVTSVFLGNGDGTFGPPIETVFPEDVYLVVTSLLDMNGDGLDDGRFTNAFFGQAARFYTALSNGDGTFSSPIQIPASRFSPAPADFNGDGFPDFIHAGINGLVVHLGDSAVSYATSVVTPVQPPRSVDLVSLSGDFTGDGNLDVVVEGGAGAARGSGTYATFLFPGHGDGSFGGPITIAEYTLEEYPVTATAAADLDRDGRLDLIITGLTHHFLILFGNGDGTFREEAPETIATGADPRLLFETAPDIDGDGHLDVYARNNGTDDYTVLYGDGGGGFEPGVSPTAAYHDGEKVDLDDDGDLDYYLFDELTGLLTVHRTYSRDDIRMLPPIPISNPGDWRLDYVDIDGDEIEDWMLHDDAGGMTLGLFGLGALQFEPAVPLGLRPLSGFPLPGPAFVDIDGIGLPDYVIYDTRTDEFVVQLSTGLRTFGPEIVSALVPGPSPVSPRILEFANFGQGQTGAVQIRLDASRGGGWQLLVYLADAGGDFVHSQTAGVSGDIAFAELNDVNGDGNSDVIVYGFRAGGAPQDVMIFLNDGTGHLDLSDHFHAHFETISSGFNFHLVDISGEGLVDIVFVNDTTGISISLNNGDGTFRGPYHFAVNSRTMANTPTFGDFDKDGDTDIVAATVTQDALFYLENRYVE